jgi:hypothetical protein
MIQAYVVSKIANNDWPEYWPNLLELLVSQLKSGSPYQVHGSMRVLNGTININYQFKITFTFLYFDVTNYIYNHIRIFYK